MQTNVYCRIVHFIAACIVLIIMTTAAGASQTVLGWIVIEPSASGSKIHISGQIFAVGNFRGHYALRMERTGKGGTTNTGQRGSIRLAAGETKSLSQTSINLSPGDSLKVTLEIYDGEKRMASSEIITGSANEQDI